MNRVGRDARGTNWAGAVKAVAVHRGFLGFSGDAHADGQMLESEGMARRLAGLRQGGSAGPEGGFPTLGETRRP